VSCSVLSCPVPLELAYQSFEADCSTTESVKHTCTRDVHVIKGARPTRQQLTGKFPPNSTYHYARQFHVPCDHTLFASTGSALAQVCVHGGEAGTFAVCHFADSNHAVDSHWPAT
jgi:hypothetical protein